MSIYYADLHIHSHYSRATSPTGTPEGLWAAAQRKGIDVCGTGDCTHPAWFAELSAKLAPEGNGLYALRPEFRDSPVPASCRRPVHFMVTGEISSIYTRGGRCRKVHSVILFPSLESAARLNEALAKIGNIHSDGRPILHLDPRDLVTMLADADEKAVLIPAHIWTPWFSMLGAKSGFDSLAECFGETASRIFAVETGLSSDAPMNRRIRCLDSFTLVSNSDAHSPENLGRDANRFFGEPSFDAMMDGLRTGDPAVCGGTVDLFPEEGKYHLDGHRACGVRSTPEESLAHNNLCPVCGKPLTIGVLHRVVELERKQGPAAPAPRELPYHYIIPLPELIAQELGVVSAVSKKVQKMYGETLESFGPELPLLLDAPAETLSRLGKLGEAIQLVRAGRVTRLGGYDGVYGTIHVKREE
jgi:DNA helicase-2/ATP-dependent DNA helicase PcrA